MMRIMYLWQRSYSIFKATAMMIGMMGMEVMMIFIMIRRREMIKKENKRKNRTVAPNLEKIRVSINMRSTTTMIL